MKSYPVTDISHPGNWDALHATHLFPTNNRYGIPEMAHVPLAAVPDDLIPYRYRVRNPDNRVGKAVHFFVDDYRFETTWSRSGQALRFLSKYKTLLSPDFSLYRDMPQAMQIWNTYRNRWCGAYWTSLGFTVIPSISWSDDASFAFCFLGIPQRSLVAVATVGVKGDAASEMHFRQGFNAMLDALNPSAVLCYGSPVRGMGERVDVIIYPHYRERRRRQQKADA